MQELKRRKTSRKGTALFHDSHPAPERAEAVAAIDAAIGDVAQSLSAPADTAEDGPSAATERSPLRIDIGCGASVTAGFIGVDRFALPGVRVVCDLEKGLPLADNAVDYVISSHSLEHIRDIQHLVQDIYRVCRDRAIVTIIAPYYATALNQANPYHVTNFNEHTARFFTNSVESLAPFEDYVFPLISNWGVASSDHSSWTADLRYLKAEYFYMPAYRGLDAATKRVLRTAMTDVCEQMMVHLLVVKSPITSEELQRIAAEGPFFETETIQKRRQLDLQIGEGNVITELVDLVRPGERSLEARLETRVAAAQAQSAAELHELRAVVAAELAAGAAAAGSAAEALRAEFQSALNGLRAEAQAQSAAEMHELRAVVSAELAQLNAKHDATQAAATARADALDHQLAAAAAAAASSAEALRGEFQAALNGLRAEAQAQSAAELNELRAVVSAELAELKAAHHHTQSAAASLAATFSATLDAVKAEAAQKADTLAAQAARVKSLETAVRLLVQLIEAPAGVPAGLGQRVRRKLKAADWRADAAEIIASGLFDPEWYRTQAGVPDGRALRHFIEEGGRQGLSPHPLFQSAWYLARYPDVAASGINPLLHYLRHGAAEGRDPNAFFSTRWYREQHPEAASSANPLGHYVAAGWRLGYDPGPAFRTSDYLRDYPEVREAGIDPLSHWLARHSGGSVEPRPGRAG